MEQSQLTEGCIFDVQGFSVHDGPGCRTLIFLKGCTLHCDWCSNPEGIDPHPVLMFDNEKCIRDGLCVKACQHQALAIEQNQLTINRLLCRDCEDFACTKECLTNALRRAGTFTTVDQLLKIIQRDRQFWGSEGGITLTGGEPLLQLIFAKEILKRCYESYVHTAIETCGNIPWKNFEETIPWIDFIYFDLKMMDNEKHRSLTGAGNELILANARRLAMQFNGKLVFRIPVIPGINDTQEQIENAVAFMKETGIQEINLLPLHHLGKEKYRLLGRNYPLNGRLTPNRFEMIRLQEIFRSHGVKCFID